VRAAVPLLCHAAEQLPTEHPRPGHAPRAARPSSAVHAVPSHRCAVEAVFRQGNSAACRPSARRIQIAQISREVVRRPRQRACRRHRRWPPGKAQERASHARAQTAGTACEQKEAHVLGSGPFRSYFQTIKNSSRFRGIETKPDKTIARANAKWGWQSQRSSAWDDSSTTECVFESGRTQTRLMALVNSSQPKELRGHSLDSPLRSNGNY
jgi:hypothetical protein